MRSLSTTMARGRQGLTALPGHASLMLKKLWAVLKRPSFWAWLFALIITVGAAFLVGAALAIGMRTLAIFLVLGVVGLVFYWFYIQYPVPKMRDALFWVMLLLIVLVPMIHKTTGRGFYFSMEVFLLLLLPLTLTNFGRAMSRSGFLWMLMFTYAAFVGVSLLSSYYGRSTFWAGLYQFITNFKVIWLLLLGFYIAWSDATRDWFWKVVQWFWLPLSLMIIWQYIHPSSHFKLFGYADPDAPWPTSPYFGEAYGFFQHPAFLAMYAATFSLLAFAKGLVDKDHRFYWPAFVYFLVLICSFQRQELAGAIITALIVFVVALRDRSLPLAFILAMFITPIIIFGYWTFYEEGLISEAEKWGLSGYSQITLPRPVVYEFSTLIADEYFPLGSGLGTYAGAGAQRFDMSLYMDLGFQRYSWFLTKNVLMDTYWPNYIAESGWLGAALHGLFYIMLGAYAIVQSLRHHPSEIRLYWIAAMSGVLFLGMLSFSSPAFQDPGLAFLPLIFWGIAFNRTRTLQPGVSLT